MQELIDAQNNDTFFSTMLINDKKVSSDEHFICDNSLLHKVVREDDKIFHALVVPIAFSKHILHDVHNTLGHICAAKTDSCLK